jgi:ABC-type methionine transport system ATPase subunit
MLLIAGVSGSGKTALMDICAGVRVPDEGNVTWNGVDSVHCTYDEKTHARMQLGYVFQNYALVHNFPIFDNIALPLRYHSRGTEKEIRTMVTECMELVGLSGVNARFSNELTTAQLKKAALARALITQPSLLLADELTSGCDPETQQKLISVIRTINKQYTTAVVMTCSDVQSVKLMQSPFVFLHEGTLIGSNRLPSTDNPLPSGLTAFQELL